MLQVSNLSKSFGDHLVFERVSFVLNAGERLGLIGSNGCGKTTLLKIILGELQPDTGSAWRSPAGLRVGYLAQSLQFEPGQTVGQAMKAGIAGLAEAEARLEGLAVALAAAHGPELQRLLGQYDQAAQAFERLGGYDVGARTDAILGGLGFQSLDLETPVEILSGGQKTRLGLARLLLANPDLLLLDEPTNHLDIGALEWLEQFLRGYRGAILIVSHDRAFLDHTVSAVLELDELSHTAVSYPGTYSAYVEAKEREREKQWAAYREQQEFIIRLQSTIAAKKGYARSIEQGTIDFAPRKIAKGIAHKAVIQQRRLQRLLDSEERIERPGLTWQMKLDFAETAPTGRDVLRLEGVSMGFGPRELFRDVTLTLRAGERVALVGPNGSGKTTLARLILGELPPWSGRIRLGTGVRLGYYAQEQQDLDPDGTPYESILAVAPLSQTEVRSFLHRFLFAGDEVFLPVRSLSFGERARLSLARLVVQGCNFLLLDEPINHLDIPSRSRFEQAMSAFTGTVLAIVHDRYFIEHFATGVWAIEGATICTYAGLEDARRAPSVHSLGRDRQIPALSGESGGSPGTQGRAFAPD
jgi:ATP-binding cassette subfamily F protein 3